MTTAFVFPGQGSQAIGMGKALADTFVEARDVFAEVDDALGQHLSKILWEGPEADLTATENAQPALMAVSLAAFRVLEKQAGLNLTAGFVAGHSLGEYSALAAAGTFSIADTARLLRIRGHAMQSAMPAGKGAMAAILGLELETLEELLDEKTDIGIANDNAPGQVVVSGAREAVEAFVAVAKDKGAKRSVLLNVSAPFHSPFMKPAADAMKAALEKVTMQDPAVPLIANVTAAPLTKAADIRGALVAQVCGRVRWRESMEALRDLGVTRIVEVGHGAVLAGLAKRIHREWEILSIGAPADVEAFCGR